MFAIRNLFLIYALLNSVAATAVYAGGAAMPAALRSAFVADRYKVEGAAGSGYHAWNAANRISAGFQDGATEIGVNGQRLRLTLAGYGWDGRARGPGLLTHASVSGSRLDRVYASGLREWFDNEAQGLEQGFVVEKRRGKGGLTIRLGVSEGWQVSGAGDRVLFTQGDVRVGYSGLKAWDSRGVSMGVGMRVLGREVVIEVEDSGAVYPITVDPMLTLQQELTASDELSDDEFGYAVALSGDGLTALVGAYFKSFGVHDSPGAAYVYIRNGTTWSQQQELTASDGVAGDWFGYTVALSSDGSTALVGAPDKRNAPIGAAYVFTRAGTAWSQQQELTGVSGGPGAQVGTSVALSGDGLTALAGVYVYVSNGSTWTFQAELATPNGVQNNSSGGPVALSGDGSTALVGGVATSDPSLGAVYLFTRNGATWSRQQELMPSDGGAAFGASVLFSAALSGDGSVGLVGAYNIGNGSAYVFVRNGTSWSQQQELTASDGVVGDGFGYSVALSGDGVTAVAGAYAKNRLQGTAYVFASNGTVWTQQQELTPSGGNSEIGLSVALSGDGTTVLVGAEGAAYVFAALPKLAFTSQPANGTAGTAISPVVVEVQDSSGNLITTSTASITLTSSPAGVNVTVAAMNGVATFGSLVFNTAGSYTLTASSSGITSATSNSFSISPGNASKVVFSTQPLSGVAGTAIPAVVVQVQDGNGNVVTTSNASVTLTSSPAGINVTVPATNGVATFNGLTFSVATNYTLMASSIGLAGVTSNSFSIGAGGSSKLVFTAQPSNGIAGSAIPAVVVQVQDGNGNLVTSSTASITLASNPAGVNATVAAVAGVAMFGGLVFNAAGGYTLSASGVGLASGSSNSFTISAGGASKLVFTAQPSNGAAGIAIPPVVVQVQDTFGNVVSSSGASVTLTSFPPAVNSTIVAVNGVATFNGLTFSSAISYTLMASSSGLIGASSNSFTISAGGASKLVFITQISGGLAGSALLPVEVEVQDSLGNPMGSSSAAVTLTSSPAGIKSTVNAFDGIAIFNGLVLSVPGSYTLSASSPGLNSATSNPFNIVSATYTISGQVTLNGSGLSGVGVTLSGGATAFTDGLGNYSFAGLPAGGNYTVTPALGGYTFAPPNQTFMNLGSNQTANFVGAVAAGVTVSGQVTASGVALGGVTISVNGSESMSTVTNAAGNYLIVLAPGGTYTLSAALAQYSFNGPFVLSNLSSNQGVNFTGIPVAGLDFYPVTPCRIVDTRAAAGFSGQFGPPAMGSGMTRVFGVLSSPCAAGIPSNVAAYSLNFTVVPPAGGPQANLTTWPTGLATGMPNVSTLNYSGSVVANAAIVPAGVNGSINVYVNASTDVLFDINGYFASPLPSGLEFFAIPPCRVADTRAAAGFSGQFGPPSLAGGGTRTFVVPASTCAIPMTASAYSLNFTVVPPAGGPAANLTTWPAGGTAMPNVSTLNYSGSVVANAAMVPAGTNDAINVYVNDPTDMLFDANGYFASSTAGLRFYPVTPCRVADTRAAAGFSGQFGAPSMAGGTTRTFVIPASTCGIPATASAYSLNFTVVPSAGGPAANLTTWPAGGTAMPNVSTLNYYGSVVANAAIVPAGTNGAINVFVNFGTDVLFDVNGYFAQ